MNSRRNALIGILIGTALLFSGGASQASPKVDNPYVPKPVRVQADLRKSIASTGFPVDGVKCHFIRMTENVDEHESMWKCSIDMRFGADNTAIVWWSHYDGRWSIGRGFMPAPKGYPGDWYDDCQRTHSDRQCLKIGRRAMRHCLQIDIAEETKKQERRHCYREIYGKARRD